jgi:hypothetical protein
MFKSTKYLFNIILIVASVQLAFAADNNNEDVKVFISPAEEAAIQEAGLINTLTSSLLLSAAKANCTLATISIILNKYFVDLNIP